MTTNRTCYHPCCFAFRLRLSAKTRQTCGALSDSTHGARDDPAAAASHVPMFHAQPSSIIASSAQEHCNHQSNQEPANRQHVKHVSIRARSFHYKCTTAEITSGIQLNPPPSLLLPLLSTCSRPPAAELRDGLKGTSSSRLLHDACPCCCCCVCCWASPSFLALSNNPGLLRHLPCAQLALIDSAIDDVTDPTSLSSSLLLLLLL
jgi:hypothetical protein